MRDHTDCDSARRCLLPASRTRNPGIGSLVIYGLTSVCKRSRVGESSSRANVTVRWDLGLGTASARCARSSRTGNSTGRAEEAAEAVASATLPIQCRLPRPVVDTHRAPGALPRHAMAAVTAASARGRRGDRRVPHSRGRF